MAWNHRKSIKHHNTVVNLINNEKTFYTGLRGYGFFRYVYRDVLQKYSRCKVTVDKFGNIKYVDPALIAFCEVPYRMNNREKFIRECDVENILKRKFVLDTLTD